MRTIPSNNISCEKLNGSIVSVATSNSLPLISYGTTRAVKASGSMKRNKTQNYNLRILCFFVHESDDTEKESESTLLQGSCQERQNARHADKCRDSGYSASYKRESRTRWHYFVSVYS